MNDKIVSLYKHNFTEEDWLGLSFAFNFNSEDESIDLHIIIDDDEDIERCEHCGCEENIEDLIDGMCSDCYEDYLEDCKEDEEE